MQRAPVSRYRRLPRVALAVLIGLALAEGGLRAWGVAYLAAARRGAAGEGERAGPRIACLGDSNVFGIFTEAAESYPAQLERLLVERGEGGAQVLNLGRPGASTLHVVRELPGVIDQWRPDAVLVTAGVNNAWAWVGGESARAGGPPWYAELRLYKLASTLRRELGGSGAGPAALAKGSPLDQAARERSIRRDLEHLWRIAGESGTPLLFVGYAADERGYAEANRALRAFAGERGAALADPAPAVRDLQARLGEAALFFPDLHPRPPGYAVVARVAYNELLARGLVRGEPIAEPCAGIGAQGAGAVRLSLAAAAGDGGGAGELALAIAGGPPGAPFRAVAYGLGSGDAAAPPFEAARDDPLCRALRGRLRGRLDAQGAGRVALPWEAFPAPRGELAGARLFCTVFFEPAAPGERPAPPVGPVPLRIP